MTITNSEVNRHKRKLRESSSKKKRSVWKQSRPLMMQRTEVLMNQRFSNFKPISIKKPRKQRLLISSISRSRLRTCSPRTLSWVPQVAEEVLRP